MFMLGMLKTILNTMLKYEKKTNTLYGKCWNWVANFVFLDRLCTSNWSETYLFFLNVALVTLVYANGASLSSIFWQLLRFNDFKKHFPQIQRFERFENGLGKKFPDLKFFSLILAEKTCFSLISLTGKSLQNFLWFPWSVGTLQSKQAVLKAARFLVCFTCLSSTPPLHVRVQLGPV